MADRAATLRANAQRTAAIVAHARRTGQATRRTRMPAYQWPARIEEDYARAIAAAADVRDDLEPLMRALPELLRGAAQALGRADEGESARARQLLQRARARLEASLGDHTLEPTTRRYAHRTLAHHQGQLQRQMRAKLGVDLQTADPGAAALVEAFVSENVALIRSLGTRTLDEVAALVTRAFGDGARAESVVEEIQARYGIAERHARLIARDQVGKLNGRIAAARHQELGIGSFKWRSMKDQRVRPRHVHLDGQVFRYPEGAPGEGIPGHPIQCRCFQEPVVDDILAELEALEAGEGAGGAPAPGAGVPGQVGAVAGGVGGAPPAGAGGPPGGGGGGGSKKRGGTGRGGRKSHRASTAQGRAEMAQRTIVKMQPLEEGGIQESYKVRLDDGTDAVWKPQTDIEWDGGMRAGGLHHREAAASRVAGMFGVEEYVPATVVHVHEGTPGSLQSYSRWARRAAQARAAGARAPRQASELLRVFDFVLGQEDRHDANLMLIGRGKSAAPVFIDHGFSLRTSAMGQFLHPIDVFADHSGPILPATIAVVDRLDAAALARALREGGIEREATRRALRRLAVVRARPELLEVPPDVSNRGWYSWNHLARNEDGMFDELDEASKGAVDAVMSAVYGP